MGAPCAFVNFIEKIALISGTIKFSPCCSPLAVPKEKPIPKPGST
jgi:hypothetical protein